ncbi:hypothetical protein [Umezawaea sp.]|uniref:hypothetical protein n=1 Tax=Umezawaea sp. TaxID=1955258 RepID=UPI002ED14443
MKFAVLVAAVAVAVVGTAAPAAAEPDQVTTRSFSVGSTQAPVGGDVRIRGVYRSAQQAEFLCETDFGDDQVATGPCDTLLHPYAEPGTYRITQTARTTTGLEVVSTGSIVVVPSVGPLTVTATASLSGPRTVVVHTTFTNGYDVTRLRVDWDDTSYTTGPADSMQDIDYTYAEPGTYAIRVRATDSSGALAYTTTTVEIS